MQLHDANKFFIEARGITHSLGITQTAVINNIMATAPGWSVAWLAYGLATAWHEAHFMPQDEWGHGAGKLYAQKGKYGQPQYGRGLVQLTWDSNYEWADQALGLNGALLKNFGLANDPVIAAKILVKGMETGHFTGKKLASYLEGPLGTLEEFVQCRRIINGQDRAQLIASYALEFQAALVSGLWS